MSWVTPLTIDALLRRLERLHPRSIDLSLDRVASLMGRLGDPQDRLPAVVHVAGTNGKGSTIAFLRAILEAHGRRVHVYTSPHLVRFNERIVLAGAEIDDDTLIALLEDCEAANAGAPITFFEVTTAAAFLAFSRVPADVLLLETGLGGRLDATNLVRRPAVTVLTPIALDHQSYLGATLAAIAAEKAGILKPGVVCVSAGQAPEARAVIEARAADLGATVLLGDRDWRIEQTPRGPVFANGRGRRELPAPALTGAFQVGNAGLATAVAEQLLAADLDPERLAQGIATARWPGRLQRLPGGALAAQVPADWEVWIDGGHNPAAAVALAEHLGGWADRPVILIVGMLQTKDAGGFLGTVAPRAELILTVPVPETASGVSAEALQELAASLGHGAEACADVAAALQRAHDRVTAASRVLICGSLYLIGSVLRANRSPESGGA